jgi:hypothetical protein
MENTSPASFIKANAFVIESLEEDLILNNENFPSESVIYIVKAKNDFSVSKLASVVFNNHETGFTTDRSFEIWLEKDTGQDDMLLLKNGKVEGNALNRGECVRLFFDYETSNWSVVYIAADKNGLDGKDGANGKDGRGITQVQINENGDLIISYTNGVEENAGHIGINNAGVGVSASLNYARHITADVTGVSIAETWTITQGQNDPSPKGYRVPTNTELASLLDKNNVLNEVILHNGIQCRKFTDIATNNYTILPVSYFRGTSGEHSAGIGFYYWSCTSHTTVADLIDKLEIDKQNLKKIVCFDNICKKRKT